MKLESKAKPWVKITLSVIALSLLAGVTSAGAQRYNPWQDVRKALTPPLSPPKTIYHAGRILLVPNRVSRR
jgi:hypothetical protein